MPGSACRSCGQEILWAVTAAKGRRIPLDPEPVPDGNVILVQVTTGVTEAVVLRAEDRPAAGKARYVSHFSTCPQAAQHRRRG